jgi:DNA-binding transcriptional LysR family regulator
MEVSVKGLKVFITVAEELHFGRAAERLGIAQPAVSQQIQRLESSLGLALIDRSTPRPRLTAAGSAFLPEARRSLEAQRRAVQAAKDASRGQIGELGLGITATVPPETLIELLRTHAAAYPGVAVRTWELTVEQMLARLADDELDLGATTGFAAPPAGDGIQFAVIGIEGLSVAMHRDHRLAGRQRLSLSELTEERFAIIARDGLSGRSFGVHGMCERQGFEPKVFAEVRDTTMQLAMVATGAGVAVAAHSAARYAPAELAFVPLEHDQPLLTLLAYRTGERAAALENLLALAVRRREDEEAFAAA